jgi:cell division protein FtsW
MKNYSKILLALVSILLVLGVILVLSASSTYSALKFDSFSNLFNNHIMKVILAVAVLIIFAVTPYHYYQKYSKKFTIGIIVVLFLTFLLAAKVKGAGRWIDFYLFTIQPSEVAKIILLVHLASLIDKKGELIKNFKMGFIYPVVWIFITAGLVLVQPNLSTSIVIVLTSFTVLYVGGAKLKHIITTLGFASIFGGSAMMLFSHSRERILTYLNSIFGGGEINIQVTQAKIALGSGGLAGLGIVHSRQADLFLPEAYGDFIFSILGEEMGFIGAFIVLFIYLAIFFIGILIAKRAKDDFGQLLAFGLAFNIVISAFINAAVVIGLLPTTGITLPFISYGGTSITFMCASIGIILNIARNSRKKEESAVIYEE